MRASRKGINLILLPPYSLPYRLDFHPDVVGHGVAVLRAPLSVPILVLSWGEHFSETLGRRHVFDVIDQLPHLVTENVEWHESFDTNCRQEQVSLADVIFRPIGWTVGKARQCLHDDLNHERDRESFVTYRAAKRDSPATGGARHHDHANETLAH